MNLILPVLSAVFQAGAMTIDKAAMSVKHLNYKGYTVIVFPMFAFIMWVFFFIVRPPFSFDLLTGKYLLFIVISVLAILLNNVMYYRAMKREHLNELEAISLFGGVPVILTTSLLFANERNWTVMLAALAAVAAIVWSHWHKHHFKIAKRTVPYFLTTVTLAPLSAIMSKELLAVWHPISLEIIRTTAAAAILVLFFWSARQKIEKKTFWYIVVLNTLSAASWILYDYSYQHSGVVYTVLVFSLSPLLIYFSSVAFLKEKFEKRKFTAFVIILLSVIVAHLSLPN